MDIATLLAETTDLLLTASNKGGIQQLVDLSLQTDFHIGVVGRRYPLLEELTVEENIALPGMYHRNLNPQQVIERLQGPLEILDLLGALSQRPTNLSRRDTLKVKLLRCLGQDSGIILLPTPGVEDVTQAFEAAQALKNGVRIWVACLDKTAPAYDQFNLKPMALQGTP
ncbi:hypothetical protein [Desulfovibrio ferrophilus]|uniref:ABC transporter family protein n=1 Tax=Desulfovibrio ferrophilus TaxID=241368 RepID=A0A2Z6AWL5_9BACT|nr:hypothetical protein [Desulfovibrio ferrophilus]BBD07595.1 ABC transporter family protein [Desulfovibrio ferrophilus]